MPVFYDFFIENRHFILYQSLIQYYLIMNTYFDHNDIHTTHIFDFETECFFRDPLEFNKTQTRKILSELITKLTPLREACKKTIVDNPLPLIKNYMITHKSCDFDYWFALKLRQYQMGLKNIFKFLDHHLAQSFNNDRKQFNEFLKLTLLQYEKIFFNKKVSRIVKDYRRTILLSRKNKSQKIQARKPKTSYSTFLLKSLENNPNYIRNHIVVFMDIWYTLKKEGFINKNTTFQNFKAIFKNQPIESLNRIKWIGTNKELQWFVKYLVYESRKVVDLDKDIWLITMKCFVNVDEKEYTESQLRNASGYKIDRKKLLKNILNGI